MDEITQLAEELGQALLAAGAQVTTAESCTGGGIAEAVTRIPGSSAWFEAGYVSYGNQQKTAMLQVPPQLIDSHGAVSLQVVEAMARGAQQASAARYAVAVSGIAGPDGGSAAKPVGTVCFAWADADYVHSRQLQLDGDRAEVRRQTVVLALRGLLLLLAADAAK